MSITHLGYCRVSTQDQKLDMQVHALKPLCGDRIWMEKKSGTKRAGRKQLELVIDEARRLKKAGEDVAIVVYSLSRLGRRVIDIGMMLEEFQQLGIRFISTSESLDSGTAMGRCFINIIASLAQAEAEQLAERTKAGLEAAKERGVKLGRPLANGLAEIDKAKELLAAGSSLRSAAKAIGVSHTTLLKSLRSAA